MWFLVSLFVAFATVIAKITGATTLSWWVILAPAWVTSLVFLGVLWLAGHTRERV